VLLASRGLRDLGGGVERIADADELATVRAQARRVSWMSLAATVLATAVLYLLS